MDVFDIYNKMTVISMANDELLSSVDKDHEIMLCTHFHYGNPVISIYKEDEVDLGDHKIIFHSMDDIELSLGENCSISKEEANSIMNQLKNKVEK